MVFSFSVCFTQKLVTRLYCVSNVRTRNTCTMCFCIQAKCGDLKAIIVKPSFSEKMWENREHKYSTTIVCQYITDIVQYFKGSSHPWKIYLWIERNMLHSATKKILNKILLFLCSSWLTVLGCLNILVFTNI